MEAWRDRIWANVFWRTAAIAILALFAMRLLLHALLAEDLDRSPIVSSAFNSVAVGVAMGVGAHFRAKRERAMIGLERDDSAAELALGRALRAGCPPADPALAAPLRRLVDLRLRAHRHDVVAEVVVGLCAVGGVIAAAVTRDVRWLATAAVFGALGVVVVVVNRRQRRRLLSLDGALPARESGHATAESAVGS